MLITFFKSDDIFFIFKDFQSNIKYIISLNISRYSLYAKKFCQILK